MCQKLSDDDQSQVKSKRIGCFLLLSGLISTIEYFKMTKSVSRFVPVPGTFHFLYSVHLCRPMDWMED